MKYFNSDLIDEGEHQLLYEKRIRPHKPQLEQDACDIHYLLSSAKPNEKICGGEYLRKINKRYHEITELMLRIKVILHTKGEEMLFSKDENERLCEMLIFDYCTLLGKLLCTKKRISNIYEILSDEFGLKS